MDSGMDSDYVPPLGLTIISSISIGIAGLVALWIMLDIIWRRGWKTMMAIMFAQSILRVPLRTRWLTRTRQDTRLHHQRAVPVAHHAVDISQFRPPRQTGE